MTAPPPLERWLRGEDDVSERWLVAVARARPEFLRTNQPPVHTLETALWLAAQLHHLSTALRTVPRPAFHPFTCHTFDTNVAAGEALHLALVASRMLLQDATRWPTDGAPPRFAERARQVAEAVALVRLAQAGLDGFAEHLPRGVAADLRQRLTRRAQVLAALGYWWKSRGAEDGDAPLPPVETLPEMPPPAGLAARMRARFDDLACAQQLLRDLPTHLPYAPHGGRAEVPPPPTEVWSSQVRPRCLLAQGQCAFLAGRTADGARLWLMAHAAGAAPQATHDWLLHTARGAPVARTVEERTASPQAVAPRGFRQGVLRAAGPPPDAPEPTPLPPQWAPRLALRL